MPVVRGGLGKGHIGQTAGGNTSNDNSGLEFHGGGSLFRMRGRANLACRAAAQKRKKHAAIWRAF
jgi:hypothetical protein